MKRLTTRVERELETAVNEAVEMLEKEGIDYRLVGTSALRLMGFDVPWGGDVDILCDRSPEGATLGYDPTNPQKTRLPSGGKADFIDAQDKGREEFWSNPPRVLPVGNRFVLSSDLTDVLGLKAWVGRPKDREFFDTFVAD